MSGLKVEDDRLSDWCTETANWRNAVLSILKYVSVPSGESISFGHPALSRSISNPSYPEKQPSRLGSGKRLNIHDRGFCRDSPRTALLLPASLLLKLAAERKGNPASCRGNKILEARQPSTDDCQICTRGGAGQSRNSGNASNDILISGKTFTRISRVCFMRPRP